MMHETMSGTMMWHHVMYMYLFPTIVGLVILAAVVYLIYWLFTKQKGVSLKGQTPVDMLHMRYAKGEISKKQFQKMKRQLE